MGKRKERAKAERALDRALAREFDQVGGKRAYDGAKPGRRGEGFTATAGSANVEIATALARLRARSRDLARNTANGTRALDVRAGHAVGTGILAVPDNGSDRVDNQVRQEWADWCAVSDVEGVQCFGGQQNLAYRSMCEGGDSLIRRINVRLEEGVRIPLRLQVLEGDWLDAARDMGMFEGRNARLGVALGDFDRRDGYWIHGQHPGDFNFYGAPYQSNFVPYKDVIHLYRATRAGQVRGVPIFAPVLLNARDNADLLDAVLVKARTEACFSAFVKTTGQTSTNLGKQIQEREGVARRIIERLAPGMINYLNPGEEVEFAEPSGSGQFEQVWIAGQMAFAAGTGITYDALTGDLRQANYSSLKAGDRVSRRLAAQEQELILEPQMMRRVTGWWTDAAIGSGVLRPRRDGYRWNYVFPPVEPIDPRKDLEADILAVRAGRMTPQEFIGSWGQDWRKVVADFEAFFKLVDASPTGLMLDIDPRKMTQSGLAQPTPGYASDPEPTAKAA